MSTHESSLPPAENIELNLGDGVTARTMLIDDAEEYFEQIDSDPEYFSQFNDETAEKYQSVNQVILSITNPYPPDKIRLTVRDKGELVGTVNLIPKGIRGVVGYWTGPSFQGQGYATSAVKGISEWAFAYGGFEALEAFVMVGNESSRRVLEKAGYKLTGNVLDDKRREQWRFKLAKPVSV